MHPERVRELLQGVRNGKVEIEAAIEELKNLPFEDLGFAVVDHHRELRNSFAEVIFSQGKTVDQVVAIAGSIVSRGQNLLVTRCDDRTAQALLEEFPKASYHEQARVVVMPQAPPPPMQGSVAVLCAGTADIPVAEEAAVCAEVMGSEVGRFYDIGVAGLHRLLARRNEIAAARVLIVVAGMEGALASVVGGIFDKPVVAVPTSVGYGASFGGISALLTMLNSCAAGVTVVNIDNGFGAAYAASLINKRV
ncbi:MAG: nickel pincer cofactor biosynthesis protein LarB [Candidatus Glassbacteria bacterium]|nr:nickel pincer cofactor biosynthesis protein LarB [Candidatus Glassbacteria bacterium]